MAQLAYFIPRYKRNNTGLNMVVLSLVSFILMISSNFFKNHEEIGGALKAVGLDRIFHYLPMVFLVTGAGLLIVSLFIIFIEIYTSKYTLFLDVMYAIQRSIDCNDFSVDKKALRDLGMNDSGLQRIQKRFDGFEATTANLKSGVTSDGAGRPATGPESNVPPLSRK